MKKYSLILLALALLLGTVACEKKETVIKIPVKQEETASMELMDEEEVYAVSFNPLGGKDVMPVAAFHGPILLTYSLNGQSVPEYITDDVFAKISGCGINLLHATHVDHNIYPTYSKKILDLGAKYNIGVCVWDGAVFSAETPLAGKELDNRLNEYQNHPAFCGVYVVDEPGSEMYMNGDRNIDIWAPIIRNLTELDVFAYGNLFPVWEEDKLEQYEQYVDAWCATANPMYLSFDHYLFDVDRGKILYFKNMDIIRKYADKYKIPFWTYVQAGGQWMAEDYDRDPYPTEGQMLWNVNVCLAYGSKGIEYFPVIEILGDALQGERKLEPSSGILDIMTNKTQWWHYAKQANEQIASVDHVLMNSVNKGVMVSGNLAKEETKGLEYIMQGTQWREVAGVSGDAMIGCFNYQGRTALYVVNYDWEYAQKITLDLQDVYKMTVIQNTEESKIETNKLLLDLKAGEGALVVF